MDKSIEIAKDLVELLEYAGEKFGVIADWGSTDILPYIKELGDKIVAYKLNIAILWIVVGAILLIAGIVTILVSMNRGSDGLFFLGIMLVLAGAVFIIVNMYTYIGCKTFPEKVIMDYLQSLSSTQ